MSIGSDQETDDPHEEGWDAFMARAHYNANPYAEGTHAAFEWNRGWSDADMTHPGMFDHAKESFRPVYHLS